MTNVIDPLQVMLIVAGGVFVAALLWIAARGLK